MPSDAIRPFTRNVLEADLEDLRRRLRAARFPEAETVDGWGQGVPLEVMRKVRDHWLNAYDWRACEARLNAWGQYITEIDGLDIHFLHVRSKEPNALPLIMTHGWPGSVLEFQHVIGPLTDPVAHGGKPEDAFHLVLPHCPGFGFSGKPAETGWTIPRNARAWAQLMQRLGYRHYVAQGGDYGAAVAHQMGADAPPGLVAYHLNFPIARPSPEQAAAPTEEEKRYMEEHAFAAHHLTGYSAQQGTRPQTLGYGLTDSPLGQAAWIYEKFRDWTGDCGGDPLNVFALDDLLDNITLYWLSATAASSGRMYWQIRNPPHDLALGVKTPAGYSGFQGEIRHATRRWMERYCANLIYWNEPPRGGHFAALQEPVLFVEELRNCFGAFRG